MNIILITPRIIENDSYFEIREAIDQNWGKLLREVDIMPIVVQYNIAPQKYFSSFPVKGVILTGGNDLCAHTDSQLSVMRDDYENKLIEKCISKKIPLFGVCRGMQLIASFFKTKLEKIENHVDCKHNLKISNESNYLELKGIKEVNSYHNYGIKKLESPLKIIATSEDGYVEAFEHEELPIVAIMWHPERENPFTSIDKINLKVFLRSQNEY
jgi:N5-(cytidine 5'-diphosphoramidyl)-L-glutamine hydrolase